MEEAILNNLASSTPSSRLSSRLPTRLLLLATLASVLLVACGSPPPPPVSPQDIQQAAGRGQLPDLYRQIEADLANPDLKDETRRELELRLSDVGQRLAEKAESKVGSALDRAKLSSGYIPLNSYKTQEGRLDEVEAWSPAVYQRVSTTISDGRASTLSRITALETELLNLGPEDVQRKLAIFDELGELHGRGSSAEQDFAARREGAVAALREEASRAIENEQYSDAQRMLAIVAEVKPDADIEGDLVQVDAKLFEQRFYEALEKDEPDEAYAVLVTLSESDNFDRIRPRLSDSADVMADYFVALAAGATESEEIVDAHRWFSQARDIRVRLGLKVPDQVAEEQPFVEEMHRRFEIADARQLHGLAWGYLNVIHAMQKDAPTLRRELRETRERVMSEAIKRISASHFEDSQSGPRFGDTVTAKIVQYLFQNLSDDVRIIEREKLAAIEAERGRKGASSQLAAVDFLIEGNILEAKVDETDRTQNKRIRIVTGREKVSNPEYQRWSAMSADERKAQRMTTPPPRTIEKEMKEDISLQVTHHRKVGAFSVSYRVIDSSTAKVLFADTQRVKREVEDTSSDGVELGDFKQEFKVARMPSNLELLDELADEVSAAIGAKLAEVLADPEAQYEANAHRFVREGNFVDASQNYAYSIVLADRKEKDTKMLRESLRDSAVSAIVESD